MRTNIKRCFFISLLAATSCAHNSCLAQTDTLRVMAYNVLGYGSYPLCQGPDSFFNAYLGTIIRYTHPDLLSLEKLASLQTSPADHNYTGAIGFQDSILRYALNAAYPGRYTYCPFTNYAGNSLETMVFYNQQKLGFADIVCTYTNTEDFNTYKLYYLDPNLATTHDTTFLYVTAGHDISGSSASASRGAQIAGEMAAIKTHFTHLANMINMGDFNVRNSAEPVYQTLTNPADTSFRYYDPPFFPDAALTYPADWDGSPAAFTSFLTTSTRSTAGVPNSCGVGGGAKDWYDHIFLSPWIIEGANYIRYLPHSYTTLGNDGHRLNISSNDLPANTAVPAAVADALYTMSDKYPVMVDLLVTQNTSGVSPVDPEITPSAVVNRDMPREHVTIVNPAGHSIVLYVSSGLVGQYLSFECTDMSGRVLMNTTVYAGSETIEIPCRLTPGTYCASLSAGQHVICRSIIAKD